MIIAVACIVVLAEIQRYELIRRSHWVSVLLLRLIDGKAPHATRNSNAFVCGQIQHFSSFTGLTP